MPVDPSSYNEFIHNLELLDIRLVAASIDAQNEYGGGDISAHITSDEPEFSIGPERIEITQRLTFEGCEETTNKTSLAATATFCLTYATTTHPSREILQVFAARNLPVNLWPYFREFMHNTVARTGWPRPILPVFKIGQRAESRTEPARST